MLTRGTSVFTPVFLSSLAPVFSRYIDLKRALGRRFDIPARTLQSLDRFLQEHSAQYLDLNAAAFEAWCHTHEHVSSGVRRVRMLEVAAFCLYRRRTEPLCFAPDPSSFPAYHQRVKPYIFSDVEVTKLLRAASRLPRSPTSPLRPEVIRLAIVLLFTTGIRRGELLALNLGDYNARESTLHIRETKFYKSRMLPLNGSIAEEMDQCLCAPARRKLPASPDTRPHLERRLGWRSLQRHVSATRDSAPTAKMRHRHSERQVAADSRFSPCLCGECPVAVVSGRGRCRSQTAVAGDLPGARLRDIDALLPALHRTAPRRRQ